MKKIRFISIITVLVIAAVTVISSCKTSAIVEAKSGAQIWGETCVRCHNSASPEVFSDVEWDVADMHMKIRANLTEEEAKKVLEFLQSAN